MDDEGAEQVEPHPHGLYANLQEQYLAWDQGQVVLMKTPLKTNKDIDRRNIKIREK